jgi:hypothetical protein
VPTSSHSILKIIEAINKVDKLVKVNIGDIPKKEDKDKNF